MRSDIDKQFAKFKSVFGFAPDHLDIHKPAKTQQECDVYKEVANIYSFPTRNINGCHGPITTNKYINGTNLDIDDISNVLSTLKDGEDYEILFHPGTFDPDCKSSLNKDREFDVQKIYKVHDLQDKYNIELISFNDLK